MSDECWCGLLTEHHDGREMDADGDMHRFGEPVYKPLSTITKADYYTEPAELAPLIEETKHEPQYLPAGPNVV